MVRMTCGALAVGRECVAGAPTIEWRVIVRIDIEFTVDLLAAADLASVLSRKRNRWAR